MAKKIKSSDIFAGDLFDKQKQGAINFLEVIKDLKKENQELLKVYMDQIKNVNANTYKGAKEIEEKSKAVKALADNTTKLVAEEQKAVKVVKELTATEAKLKVEVQEKNRVTKLEAQSTSQVVGAYKNLSAQLNLNKKQYKDLAAAGKENTKEAKLLKAEITSLDKKLKEIDASTGDFNREVGNYKQSIKDAIKETGLFGGIGLKLQGVYTSLTGTFSGFKSKISETVTQFKEKKKELNDSAKGAGIYRNALVTVQIATAGVTAATKLMGLALKATGIGLIIGAIGSLGVALTKTQKGADDVSVVMEGLKFALDEVIGAIGGVGFGLITLFKGLYNNAIIAAKGFQVIGLEIKRAFTFKDDKLDKINKQINQLNSEITELGKEKGISDGLKEIGQAVDGIVSKTTAAFLEGEKLGRIIVKFRDRNLELRKELTVTDTELALANQKASDATLSYRDVLDANSEAAELQIKVSGAQVEIARNNNEIALAELEAKQKAGLKDIELREKQVATLEALDKAESALALAKANRDSQLRKIKQDELISELLVLEKQFDKISKFREEEINDAEKSIQTRKDLFEDLKKVSSDIFDSEVSSIEKTAGIQIDANELINESNAELLQRKIRGLNLNIEIEKALNKSILQRQKQLLQEDSLLNGINKQIETNNRLRTENNKIINELDIENELINLEKEIDLQKDTIKNGEDITANTDKLNQLLRDQFALKEKLLKENASAEISKAEKEITEEDIKAQEIIKINKKLKNDLDKLRIDETKAIKENNQTVLDAEELDRQKELDARKKREAEIIDSIKNITDNIFKELDKQAQKQIETLDKEIQNRQQSVSKQEELAAKGLNNTLQYEQKKLAEAELQKKRLQDEQERREKRLAYLKAFTALLEENPNTAAFKALAQVLVAESVVRFLATGEENLKGPGSTTSDSIPAMLSRGESVVTAKGTKETAGLVTRINKKGVKGAHEWFEQNVLPKYLASYANLSTDVPKFGGESNTLVAQKIDKLTEAVKNKKEINVSWDGLEARYETMISEGFKKTVKHVSKRPRI